MRRAFRVLTLLAVISALPMFADRPMTMTPSSGPVTGGTLITITGDFNWPNYAVRFGSVWMAAVRIDAHTLHTVSPPHAAGVVPIEIFEGDMSFPTDMTFTFGGPGSEEYERFLLPIFIPPVRGAFGSEFYTSLSLQVGDIPGSIILHGLEKSCRATFCSVPPPPPDPNPTLVLEGGEYLMPLHVEYNGAPGRFFEIAKEHLPSLNAYLRVLDLSRGSDNFGTQLPLVRRGDFRKNRVVLLDVPLYPEFRNTLRIYGDQPFWANVTVGDHAPVRVRVDGASGLYIPSYGVFTDFPDGPAMSRVTIDAEPDVPGDISFWAFVTVTNNNTQMITTITP